MTMLPSFYQSRLNLQALKRLDGGVDIPAPQLGVDFSEYMERVPVRYTAPVQKTPVVRPPTAIEHTGMDGQGNPVPNTFPNSGYFGDAIGGLDESAAI